MNQKEGTDIRLYLRLMGYVRPYWRIALLSMLAMLVSAALEPVLPALMQPLIDKSLIQRHEESLWQVPLLIVLTFSLKGVADYIATVSSQTVAQKTIADLRGLIFSHQLDLPLARHRTEEGGRMLSRITYDTMMVGDTVSTAWLTIIRDTFVLIGLLGFLFYTAWQLTLLVFLIVPVLSVLIRRINGRLRKSSERVQGWMGRVTGLVEEAMLGLREIKIFAAHDTQADRFKEVNQGLRREQMRVVRVQAINVPLVQVLAACSIAMVVYAASFLSQQDLLSPGEFVAFVTAMSMIFEPIRRLANVSATLQKGLAAAESIFSLLDESGETRSNSTLLGLDRVEVVSSENTGHPPPSINFKSVSYKYPDSEAWVIRNFSLKISGGQTVAVIGSSGSGKSSLLNLLCGFDRPSQGNIFIDDCPIDKIPIEEIRAKISLVGQQTLLFDLSVSENLRLAKPLATDSELVEALQMAHADEFVRALPFGLNTPLGPLGQSLSGGQRQRLSLARAFLKGAPILLLDEPTSALDGGSEKKVLENLEKFIRTRTTLIVSHHPERILKIDQVVQL